MSQENPAIRDLINVIGNIDLNQAHDAMVKFFLVHGVKIGGIYKHFKGGMYEVTGVGNDCNNWGNYIVSYFDIRDTSHKATRPLEEFLGDVRKPEYQGPRFVLVR